MVFVNNLGLIIDGCISLHKQVRAGAELAARKKLLQNITFHFFIFNVKWPMMDKPQRGPHIRFFSPLWTMLQKVRMKSRSRQMTVQDMIRAARLVMRREPNQKPDFTD